MERPAGCIVGDQQSRRMACLMTAGVPSTLGKIQSAGKGERLVDNDDLLVMRRSDRMHAVFVEVQAPMGGKLRGKPPFPLLPINHVEVPRQDVNVEAASANQQVVEKRTETVGEAVRFTVHPKADTTVEIPTDDEDRVAGANGGRAKRREVRVSVNEKRDAGSVFDSPAVTPHVEQRGETCRPQRGGPGVATQWFNRDSPLASSYRTASSHGRRPLVCKRNAFTIEGHVRTSVQAIGAMRAPRRGPRVPVQTVCPSARSLCFSGRSCSARIRSWTRKGPPLAHPGLVATHP